ncbi:hypothetical protein AAFF_G00305890 [Aldrovandia affinis]|uniref:Uncharacterized protein n=1 Tax=Aldrovandia affinis TaxID=143900 RepID=A0AAD7SPQ9_9TELE|nr:hypothetical protein AAFF_G00305890 [Aldrovandia affinis]
MSEAGGKENAPRLFASPASSAATEQDPKITPKEDTIRLIMPKPKTPGPGTGTPGVEDQATTQNASSGSDADGGERPCETASGGRQAGRARRGGVTAESAAVTGNQLPLPLPDKGRSPGQRSPVGFTHGSARAKRHLTDADRACPSAAALQFTRAGGLRSRQQTATPGRKHNVLIATRGEKPFEPSSVEPSPVLNKM